MFNDLTLVPSISYTYHTISLPLLSRQFKKQNLHVKTKSMLMTLTMLAAHKFSLKKNNLTTQHTHKACWWHSPCWLSAQYPETQPAHSWARSGWGRRTASARLPGQSQQHWARWRWCSCRWHRTSPGSWRHPFRLPTNNTQVKGQNHPKFKIGERIQQLNLSRFLLFCNEYTWENTEDLHLNMFF